MLSTFWETRGGRSEATEPTPWKERAHNVYNIGVMHIWLNIWYKKIIYVDFNHNLEAVLKRSAFLNAPVYELFPQNNPNHYTNLTQPWNPTRTSAAGALV